MPRKTFYLRYAAFIALGITPDTTAWPELRQKVADAKKIDAHKRILSRLIEIRTGREVIAFAEAAVKAGVPDAPPPGVVPPLATKRPNTAEASKKEQVARDEKANDFLASVKARMNGRTPAKA